MTYEHPQVKDQAGWALDAAQGHDPDDYVYLALSTTVTIDPIKQLGQGQRRRRQCA